MPVGNPFYWRFVQALVGSYLRGWISCIPEVLGLFSRLGALLSALVRFRGHRLSARSGPWHVGPAYRSQTLYRNRHSGTPNTGTPRHKRTNKAAYLLLWLVCFPTSQAVQLSQIGIVQGQPVYSTTHVPDAPTLGALAPVHVTGTHGQLPSLHHRVAPRRDFCVFQASSSTPYHRLSVDVRAHGVLLHRWVCSALRLPEGGFVLTRLQCNLPGLPPEQYLLVDSFQSWYRVHVPIDLRPIGFGIIVCELSRTATCAMICTQVASEISQLRSCMMLCRCGGRWMHSVAQPLLLHDVDTLQLWPGNGLKPSAPTDQGSGTAASAMSVTMASSIGVPGASLPASLGMDERRCVAEVLYSNGILQVDVPADVSPDAIFQLVQDAVRAALGKGATIRQLPQRIQGLAQQVFLADEATTEAPAYIVDLRQVGGRLHIQVGESGAPIDDPLAEFRQYGVASGAASLGSMLETGQILAVCEPSQPSTGGPIDLVTVRWRDYLLSEGTSTCSSAAGRSLICLGASIVFSTLRGRSSYLPLWAIGIAVIGATFPSGPAPDSAHSPLAHVFQTDAEAFTVAQHQRLAAKLLVHGVDPLPPVQAVLGEQTAADTGRFLHVQVWSPEATHSFRISYVDVAHDLRHKLKETDPAGHRKLPVLTHPQIEWPCLQFVAPSKQSELVTVLIDVGHTLHCLDVGRHSLADDIMRALTDKEPGYTFRLHRGFAASVRHGEVIRAYPDTLHSALEVGHISLPVAAATTVHALASTQGVFVLGVSVGLLRFDISNPCSPAQIVQVLAASLGHPVWASQRWLHQITLPDLAVAVYCLSAVPEQCHVFSLVDATATSSRPVLAVVEAAVSPEDALLRLQTDTEHFVPQLWDRVFRLMPVIQYGQRSPTGSRSCRAVHQHSILIDMSRAHQFGWNVQQASELRTSDHVTQRLDEPDSANGAPALASVAIQTTPSYWPAAAAKHSSGALPQPLHVQSCTPALSQVPDGPITQLACPELQVVCDIPCLPEHKVWGLRIGSLVHGVCTRNIEWQHVVPLADSSSWELPSFVVLGTLVVL